MLSISSAGLVEELEAISKDIVIIPAHCLLPGTTIQCNPDIKCIEEIKEGDFVYTHKGRVRKVTKLFKRAYAGETYKIIPWYFSLGITTTAEHPIYAIKTVKNCSWTTFYKQYKPKWIMARDIEKGDVLLYPRLNKKTSDVEKINIKDYVSGLKEDVWISINADFCRLIGYYLAKGYSNGRDAVAFTFNPNEKTYLGDVKKLMGMVFNIKYKQGKTGGDLVFYSHLLMRFFENLLYSSNKQKRAFTKSLPNWMLLLPVSKQVEIFKGWWRGDKGSTSSKILANQMKTICLRLGIIPSIRVDSRLNHKPHSRHKIGDRKISASDDNFIFDKLSFFEDQFNLLKESEFKKFNYKRDIRYGWIDENYIYLPVRKITKTYYEGYVHNLEVEEDNSYLTDFATVHNCWTPWFGVFGSRTGVDTIEEAFEDKADRIFAIETGLSSDPEMNWMISALDKYTLVSNSDCHSPEKLGREGNVFELEKVGYSEIINAIKTRKGFVKTYEFYPEEGKYHYDGHRNCKIRWSPWEAIKHNNIGPVGRKIVSVGVLHRVVELADRKPGFRPENAVPFQHIVPLSTIISKLLGKNETSSVLKEAYSRLIGYFGSEFSVFEAHEDQIRLATTPEIAEGIIKVKKEEVSWFPGYDGVFGELVLEEKGRKEAVERKQKSLIEF